MKIFQYDLNMYIGKKRDFSYVLIYNMEKISMCESK